MRLAVLLLLAPTVGASDPDGFTSEQRDHWAWKPVARSAEQTPGAIDQLIRAKLDAVGLHPAPPASREQLIRRVTFDLIGLPPTPAEIDAFVTDSSPNAWDTVIDRLLASPHYGERWGRHWLDLARYADSNGYEFDELRPDAWRYRDYVIRSFNTDMPYHRFIREQLAGDEIAPNDAAARVATGFNLLGPDMTDSSDQMQRRQNTLSDMTDTTALAVLGLTLGCARCHDHKFEPLSQADYYRFQAFFTPAVFRKDVNILPAEQRAALTAAIARYESERNPLRTAIDDLEGPYRSKLQAAKLARQTVEVREAHATPAEKRTPAQRERVAETLRFVNVSTAEVLKGMTADEQKQHRELAERLKKLDAARPTNPVAMGLEDGGPTKTYLLHRGEPANKGEEVRPGFPTVLTSERPKSGRRSALADWLTDDSNPLTARVMVNRLWQHHFGRGIVRTPSDFGVRGDPPTHPELLDALAAEFVQCGWSVKHLHRLILRSATYRQSTVVSAEARRLDADNALFSRMTRLRLEGEIVRDSLLAVSGRIDLKAGGPAIMPADPASQTRRSIYLLARRNLRNPFLEAFDLPDSNLSCSRRERSTTAPQALALLNDAAVVDAARAMAKQIQSESDPVTAAYRRALGRRPSVAEADAARAFLAGSPLTEFCRALFNLNEFVYLD